MHAFDVLGDPIRRRILEELARGDRRSGELVDAVRCDHPISQSAVSQHLRILREHGFATVRRDGTARIYRLDAAGLQQVDAWLHPFRDFWAPRLDALATEVARGKTQRRQRAPDKHHDTAKAKDKARATSHAPSSPGRARKAKASGA